MNKEKMELEEAIKILREIYTSKGIDGNNGTIIKIRKEAIETVLQELEYKDNKINKLDKIGMREGRRCISLEAKYNNLKENSIPKKKIEDKLNELLNKLASAGSDGFYDEVRDIKEDLLEEK